MLKESGDGSASRSLDFAHRFDPTRTPALVERYRAVFGADEAALGIAAVLAAAYPALAGALVAAPEIARSIARDGHATPRDRSALTRRVLSRVGGLDDAERVRRELRRVGQEERIRVALRELLPASAGGADVDVTAAELSALADVVIQTAFDEALFATTRRFGAPKTAAGKDARFTILGMGKLGGEELNAGSDVDLLYFYDTDDGAAKAEDGGEIALHDFWTRVAKRMTATLDDVTEDGLVFRVDLRLRPEGRSGPIANSLGAAERYYEAFGRLWERAALVRARAVAGDLAFGREVITSLEPFVWRRSVDPRIALEMVQLARRSRAELSVDPARDVKLAPGGIREAEFFVQTLQLVWGGREARLRVRGTLDGLRRLRAQGLVTDREFREIAAAYLALRRAEHVVQTASGIQTHLVPEPGPDRDRVGRALGFKDGAALMKDLGAHTRRVATRFASLVPKADRAEADVVGPWTEAIAAIERSNVETFVEAIVRAAESASSSPFSEDDAGGRASPGEERWRETATDLFELSRHPDAPLGVRTRDHFPELTETVLDAAIDAADPEQAARYLRRIFARVRHPGIYARLLSDDRRALRRLIEALGASAFVGEAVANHPELGDFVLFARGAPTPELARAEVHEAWSEALATPGDDEPDEVFAGALRKAKARVTIEVALADLGGELDTRGATLALSGLADATLDAAAHAALGNVPLTEPVSGLAVLAMGKLGGKEIGYGSDLDVLFLFDPEQAPPGVEPDKYFALAARRMMRLISVSHPAGPGYELDTRLRPSGSQGLLVTSLEAFARYHGAGDEAQADSVAPRARVRAAAWERLALLRARAAAGDPELGARAIQLAHAAAYEAPFDAKAVREEIHRLRTRLEHENSQERRGTSAPDRYDVKLGRGGLLDVEFAVQLLQLEHGKDPRVRTSETRVALEALAAAGYLAPRDADALREGHGFLRKLEQRIRIVHDSAVNLIEEGAPGLLPLARRMGIRTLRGKAAAAELLARYREVTDRVRETYEAIVMR